MKEPQSKSVITPPVFTASSASKTHMNPLSLARSLALLHDQITLARATSEEEQKMSCRNSNVCGGKKESARRNPSPHATHIYTATYGPSFRLTGQQHEGKGSQTVWVDTLNARTYEQAHLHARTHKHLFSTCRERGKSSAQERRNPSISLFGCTHELSGQGSEKGKKGREDHACNRKDGSCSLAPAKYRERAAGHHRKRHKGEISQWICDRI
mmetsp:Transcript_39431/g.77585  ORF Transcript_39431/g.77585 Transcript_39431/m.77585 type:complete len:212 (+) Transcript_39431:2143-2778(+)